jgi:hypothetical protein
VPLRVHWRFHLKKQSQFRTLWRLPRPPQDALRRFGPRNDFFSAVSASSAVGKTKPIRHKDCQTSLRRLVDLVSIRVHSWLTSICKTSEIGGSRATKKSQKVRKSLKNVQIVTKSCKKRTSVRANSRALVAKLKKQSQFRALRRLPRPPQDALRRFGPRNDFFSAIPADSAAGKTKPILSCAIPNAGKMPSPRSGHTQGRDGLARGCCIVRSEFFVLYDGSVEAVDALAFDGYGRVFLVSRLEADFV